MNLFSLVDHTLRQTQADSHSQAADAALTRITEHHTKTSLEDSLATTRTAARAARWLATPTATPPNLDAALTAFAHEGAWAERALSYLWAGDTDPVLANAYRTLAHAMQERRRNEDRVAATLLTGGALPTKHTTPIEELLTQLVRPLSTHHNVLLLVLDGMDVPTATELIPELTVSGWNELVPTTTRQRGAALATLPTVTEYSRSTLFAGSPTRGNQHTETTNFASECGGTLFHKNDLRSEAGHSLPTAVIQALRNPKQSVVAAVINTIDEALASADVDSLRWDASSIAHLRPLLGEARRTGRTVIITSDHGHIVERGGELRRVPDAPARWRTPDTGPATAEEVHVRGPRVLTPTGEAILAVHDGLRYASKKAGYHGGAALAELTIPVIVLHPSGIPAPPGWVEAPPQEPTWWNEPLQHEPPVEPEPTVPRPRTTSEADELDIFDGDTEPERVEQAATSLGERLLSTPTFQQRRNESGRHPIEENTVVTVIDTLIAGRGRSHQDTLANRLGVPAHRFRGTLTALRRALNVDGYEIISTDPDGVTIILDEPLLREQFHIKKSRHA